MSLLVSINCITYNHEEYIADAIEGFLMQKTDFDYEILVGEDCSTDHTRKIIQEYTDKYPDKIRLVTSEQNVGAGKNTKRIFELSRGKYIALCEGDDYWTDPYKLQKQVNYLERNPECTLCFHTAKIVRAPKNPTGRNIKPYRKDQISPMEDIISGGGGFCPTASLVYRRKSMENPPDFYSTSHVGDYPKQLILSSLGYAYYLDDSMSVYRTDVKGSWTSQLNSSENLKDKMIEVNEGDIKILVEFNKYTDYKYRKSVEQVIMEKKFANNLIRGKIKEPKNDQYKAYVSSLSLKKKLKMISLNNFPKSYGKLAEIKNYIFNIKLFN